jgi:hypothetical protein
MRTFQPPPDSVIDPVTRAPRIGSFRGPLPRVDLAPLGRGPFFRLARRKRWLWGTVASDELLAGFAVVDLGYVASAFAYAWHFGERRMLADRSALGPGFCGRVGDSAEEGCAARFGCGRSAARITRAEGSSAYEVEFELRDLRLAARLETRGAPIPLSAIAATPPDAVATTQKRVRLGAKGELAVGDRRFSLDGALGGLDYSHGYPLRHTRWKWGFALGHAAGGEPFGLNLVEGFVGEPECAVWVGDELLPLGEGRFEFDGSDLLAPWRVRTVDGAADLVFEPGGMHREEKNLRLVVSHFVQVAGRFRGTIALPGRATLRLDGVPGVTEDQEMLW